ncbi:MAG: hypothetical protein DCC68_07500 [Planctomycetota bacterium]|nr:MAG: hypothetical protein DCC68_07500 [Planctomycetota bacterium]
MPTFREFFEAFPTVLQFAYDSLPANCPACDSRFEQWKFVGDEILFCVEIRQVGDAISHLCALKTAAREFPDRFWRKKEIPLKLKAAAWIAGFPVTNQEVHIPLPRSGMLLDFVGPAMDLGFRVARYADERRLAISADLALLLLDGVDAHRLDRRHFHIHLAELTPLKGAIFDEPYPILWVDMRDGEPVLVEKLLGVKRDFRSDDLKDYLGGFLDNTRGLRRPFIDGCGDARYNSPDPELAVVRERMQAEESYYTTESGEPKAEGKAKPPDEPALPPSEKS